MAKFDIEYNLLQDAEVVVAVEKAVEVAVVVTEVAAWNAISIGNLAMIGRKSIFFEVTKYSNSSYPNPILCTDFGEERGNYSRKESSRE